MRFQIEKLLLWRRSAPETKTYRFEPGKINIVIGHRHTGKSSILKIIDYSLGAESMNIDQKVLKGVSWVGIVVVTADRRYLFARELPANGRSKSLSCYHDHCTLDKDIAVPDIPIKNKTPKEIQGILNRICGLDFVEMLDAKGGTQKLSFRYLIKLVKQDYQTLASEDELFSEMDNAFVSNPIKHWFPFILGAQDEKLMGMQVRAHALSEQVEQLQKEKSRAANVSEKWKVRLYAQLQRAQELGLFPQEELLPKQGETLALLAAAERILRDSDNFVSPKVSESAEDAVAKSIVDLVSEIDKVAIDLQTCQQRIDELAQLKSEFDGYQKAAAKTYDRLQLATWIEKAWINHGNTLFDFHGGRTEAATRDDIAKLKDALLRYEQTVMNRDKRLVFETACRREENFLVKAREKLCKRHRDLSDKLKATKDERSRMATQREAFMLLGRIFSTVELTKALAESNVKDSEIEKMLSDLHELRTSIEASKVKAEQDLATKVENISLAIHEKVQGLQLEDELKRMNVRFDIAKLDLMLSDPGTGEAASLSEHGSTNNHIAFHVATTVALQEHFATEASIPVPSFVVYDQPGQSSEPTYEQEETTEVEALTKIFEVLYRSLEQTHGYWQPIVIDLATSDSYKDIPGDWIHRVDEFQDGHGLVPQHWFVDHDK